MSHDIIHSSEGGVVHARISGVMTPDDQRALDDIAKRRVDAGQTILLLVTLENFVGWKKDPAWADDMDFQASHGNDIARIAIVGDRRWRDDALLYVGKGFRRTDVEFFTPESLDTAKAWLLQ
jgi:hypothetical protein